jgi:hypothetical protein
MKFAKIIFWVAGAWGVLTLTPLYFLYDTIGQKDPPPITHPAFYFGFAGVALAWQFAFFIIGNNPARFRPLMVVAVVEKLGFGIPCVVLYLQRRLTAGDMALGCVDLLLAVLFLMAFGATATDSGSPLA